MFRRSEILASISFGVILAKAGIQKTIVMLNSFQHLFINEISNDSESSLGLKVRDDVNDWIPAFVGMTLEGRPYV